MAEKKTDKTPDVMAEVEAKIAKMLEEAEKKATEIIEAAHGKVATAPSSANLSAAEAKMEEYVTVKLFKDNGKYSDDVFVAVNGEGCSIPRGIPVRIKRKFANVLDKSDLQDYQTSQFVDAESNKFAEQAKKLNV